jgi:nicotinamidase-related amidase
MAKRALLVIDAQNVYTNADSELHCKGAGQTIDRINDVVADAKRRGDNIVDSVDRLACPFAVEF